MDPTVSELLGHYDAAFTLKVYSHLFDGQKKKAVALLDSEWTSEPGRPTASPKNNLIRLGDYV